MQPFRSSLVAAGVALALAGAVAAQETPPEPAETAPADVPEAPATEPPAAELPATEAPAAEAPAGAPSGPTPEAGEAAGDPAAPEVMEIVRDTFDDWEVRCAPSGQDCFMYQLTDDADGNPVAEVSLLKLPEEAEAVAGMTVVTPLGTLLPAGVAIQIDEGERRQYPFAWCSRVGCFARFPLEDAELSALKRGRGATLAVASVAAPGRPLTLNLSLTGFTAAYDSLEVPELPAATAAPAPELPDAPLAPRN